MSDWKAQFKTLIAPAVTKSEVTKRLVIEPGALSQVGTIASDVTDKRRAIVFADTAGFAAAGEATCASLTAAGFEVDRMGLPDAPLPKASVEEAAPFVSYLSDHATAFPVSVGSGVMNDLVKFAAYETGMRYLSVATAASMDGYTSAGAPLARDGFKVTIPTRAPVALVADLDIITRAPAEMNGWGYGDLAGKSPAGGDWLLAELVGVENRDDVAWPLVQDNLHGWLAGPDAIATGDSEACARLFIGLTAVGFAMEFHGTSRPASGADHQIAHMWEMEGWTHKGRKVSHGAAVAVGCVISLRLYDWLLSQDLSATATPTPELGNALADLEQRIKDPLIAEKATGETRAKWVDDATHAQRLERIRAGWPATRDHLRSHLYRADDMARMLVQAGAPSDPSDIGITSAHLEQTIRAAMYIRSRYTILDFLRETGLFEDALADVMAKVTQAAA